MNLINLQDYTRHGMILNNIDAAGLYDAVLFETLPHQEIRADKKVAIYAMSDLTKTQGLGGVLSGLLSKYKRIAVVLDSLPVSTLLNSLQGLQQTHSGMIEKLTIINSSSGISGIKAKGADESADCGYMNSLAIESFDPSDVVTFFALLEHSGVRYIRLQSGDYPSSLVDGEGATIIEGGVQSLIDKGLSGAHGTTLVGGRIAGEFVTTLAKLQEHNSTYDCFLMQQTNWLITNALRDSLLKTERLYLVTDSNARQAKQYAAALLFEAGLFEIEIVCISPQAATLTGFHDDYMYEQAGFGPEAFMNELLVE